VLGPRRPLRHVLVASLTASSGLQYLPAGSSVHPPDWMICAGAKPHPNRVMPTTRPGGTVAARSP
jgi:hypothetical protein